MNEKEFIERRGEAAWEKKKQQTRDWRIQHPNEIKVYGKEYYAEHRKEEIAKSIAWQTKNPEKAKTNHHEQSHKGGKGYEHALIYHRTGLQGERNKIRRKHGYKYRPFKQIIAPDSQIHHEWIPETANWRGVALVEADQHRHGFIDVIQILEGEIILLSEEEVKNREKI